ncbi:MAG: hypothetical protein PUK34_04120 [Clostridia bacterium]|nr:hypothetical protein [Clostridia bacterium]
MSKFLKFIVHFVVICAILCVVGLVVPPFFGVTTEIRDDSTKESNLPMGSVTYAIPVKSDEIALGESILVTNGNNVSRYNIVSLDLANGTGTVIDPSVSQAQTVNVAVGSYVPKVVITIGLVGYLMVATESIEGLIILGLAVLFLIILYVIAELWKKEPDDEDIEEDTEPGYVKSKKELKREEKRRERQYKEEEREIRAEDKRSRKNKKKIRTGGFVDEIDEEDFDEPEEMIRPQKNVQTATSEAHEVLKKEIAAATAEERKPSKKAQKSHQETQKVVVEKKKFEEPEIIEEEEEEPVEIKRMAIPRYTPAQLAARAKKAGDQPDIVKDEITKVTLFDYSDIFADDEDEDEDFDNED